VAACDRGRDGVRHAMMLAFIVLYNMIDPPA
jgi:hypothetical protein